MGSIKIGENPQNRTLTIWIKGRFDFSTHREFRSAYKDRNNDYSSFVVNMREVEYIDSSALGMLLLLREHVKSIGGQVIISGSNPDVFKILKIANFDRLFDMQ